MAYREAFAEYLGVKGGLLDDSQLPDATGIYESVTALLDFYHGLGEVDRKALDLAWSTGPTADTMTQMGMPVPHWLLQAIDGIEDMEEAVRFVTESAEYAATADQT